MHCIPKEICTYDSRKLMDMGLEFYPCIFFYKILVTVVHFIMIIIFRLCTIQDIRCAFCGWGIFGLVCIDFHEIRTHDFIVVFTNTILVYIF